MLSIIIVSKNEEQHIGKLLKSIEKQHYNKDYEVILSDAKSTDKTRKIAKSYSKRIPIKVINGGLPARGRNNGARKSKGDLLLFLDSDVILPKDFLKKNIDEFYDRNLDLASVKIKPKSRKKFDKVMIGSYHLFIKITQHFYPHGGGFCILCKKNLFNKVKGFNEKIYLAEDHDFVNRCSLFGNYGLLKSVPIKMSMRRFNKEGRLEIIKKYLYCELIRFFKGEMENNQKIEYILNGNDRKR